MSGRLLSLLGRWHQWRRAYSHERGFARVGYASPADEEDELDRLTMSAMEDVIAGMPAPMQLALQHAGRAECNGVEVVLSPVLMDDIRREVLIVHALATLERLLLRAGVLW
jgi:hypothetical protein